MHCGLKGHLGEQVGAGGVALEFIQGHINMGATCLAEVAVDLGGAVVVLGEVVLASCYD